MWGVCTVIDGVCVNSFSTLEAKSVTAILAIMPVPDTVMELVPSEFPHQTLNESFII